MTHIESRCNATIDYRSRGYVEDAHFYARWILRLKDASPDERRKMLHELGANVPQSIDDELSAFRVELIDSGYRDAKSLEFIGRLLEIIAELRVQLQNATGVPVV